MQKRTALYAAGGVLAAGAAALMAHYDASAPAKLSPECARIAVLNRAWSDPVVGDGRARITVVGDSYTQGEELQHPRRDAWPVVFAETAGTVVKVDGASGTGFTNPGACDAGTFADRARGIKGLLLVQGGLNDLQASDRDLAAAVCEVLNRHGRTVVVGPPLAPWFPASAVRATDRTIRRATERCGGEFVSTLTWRLDYLGRGIHPTAASQQKFGRLVARAIQR